ncbi:MAG: hypothetical protein M3Q69_05530 [Acidobacteriota bacterium]|nr:hypothetical protein [Acidobacteriota bacterium]
MRRSITAMLCLSLALGGCKAKELADKAAISKDLQSRGTTELLKQAAEDQYEAPADGRLTEGQIQMYLKVREHEKAIAKVAKAELEQHANEAKKSGEKSLAGMMDGLKALGSAADFMTADIRAAKDLGFNTQEYLWVKGQVLAASTSAMSQKFNEAMQANFDKAYTEAKKAYDEAKDENTKKMYAEMLAGYDKSRQDMQAQSDEDPALTYNRQLLGKHEDALNAYAQELSKYEAKDGDVQKSLDEVNKNVDEAKKQ